MSKKPCNVNDLLTFVKKNVDKLFIATPKFLVECVHDYRVHFSQDRRADEISTVYYRCSKCLHYKKT